MKYIHNPFPGLYIISSPCLLIVTYNSLLQTIREKEVSRHLLKQRRYKRQREDMACRKRDAEAELNLPPGFRFHPTDEELVVDYLFRKITHKQPPVPIIADVDLYKCDPWQLPDKALFGKKEWYFFTPRDRKYPNGSRPNRAAGCGYWKATGADKPIRPRGSTRHVGIKKALVFYTGKAPKGIKTNWIMHEYRVAHSFTIADNVGNRSMKLDEWVLCRLYNKKNSLGGTEQQPDEVSSPERQESTDSQSFSAPESLTNIKRVNDNSCRYKAHQPQLLSTLNMGRSETEVNSQMPQLMKEDNWLNRMILNDLRNTSALSTFGQTCTPELTIDDYEYAGLFSPHFNQFLNDMMVPS